MTSEEHNTGGLTRGDNARKKTKKKRRQPRSYHGVGQRELGSACSEETKGQGLERKNKSKKTGRRNKKRNGCPERSRNQKGLSEGTVDL